MDAPAARRDGEAQGSQPGWAPIFFFFFFLRPANLEPWAPCAAAAPTEVAGADPTGRQGGTTGTDWHVGACPTASTVPSVHPRCIPPLSPPRESLVPAPSRAPAGWAELAEPAKPISLHRLR